MKLMHNAIATLRFALLHVQWNNVVNGQISLGFLHAQELFMACPQVKKQADGHEPELVRT